MGSVGVQFILASVILGCTIQDFPAHILASVNLSLNIMENCSDKMFSNDDTRLVIWDHQQLALSVNHAGNELRTRHHLFEGPYWCFSMFFAHKIQMAYYCQPFSKQKHMSVNWFPTFQAASELSRVLEHQQCAKEDMLGSGGSAGH